MDLQEIIQGCKDNDRKYQEILYKNYYPEMFALTREIITDSDPIDVINSAFLEVFKNIGNFDTSGDLSGWIEEIIIRKILQIN